MQKIATKVFIYSSVAFGFFGLLTVATGGPDESMFMKLVMACVFIILPSFALSVAAKYLDK